MMDAKNTDWTIRFARIVLNASASMMDLNGAVFKFGAMVFEESDGTRDTSF
jgi:hypothetical protein